MTADDMRVLVFDEPHRFSLAHRSRPVPASGEVRLKVAYVGICGSDLHGYTGESGRRAPGMVMGHEMSGWVEELGPGTSGLEVGQPVTINPALPCDGGCGHAAENQCSRLRVIGVAPEIQGAFADAIVVPADRVVGLDGVGLDAGAAVEPMAVGLQAVRRAGVVPGASVLVVGGGMIGQCIAQAARTEGAGEVAVSDVVDERLDVAAAAGFTPLPPDDVAQQPPFDVTFDAVGVTATATTAIQAVRKGGTACFVGLGAPEVTIPLFDVVVGERAVVGSFAYTDAVFRETVAAVAAGRLDVSPFLGQVVDLEHAPGAFADLASGARSDVKIMVRVGADEQEGHR